MTTVDFEYRVFGLRRGGNHAIIAWIISAMDDDSVYYFNDILHDYDKLYKSVITSHLDEKVGNLGNKFKRNPTWMEHKKCVIQSYEDQYLNIIDEIDKQKNGIIKKKINVLVLRDMYNLFASRLELYNQGSVFTEITNEVCDLWYEYATEFKNPKILASNDTVCINYNEWNTNEQYRKEIAIALGIDPMRANMKAQLMFGNLARIGGSSFLTNTYNNRWEKYKNDPVFNRYVSDKKNKDICNEIFNINY